MYEYLISEVYMKVGNVYNPWTKNFIFVIEVEYYTRTKEVNKSKVSVKIEPWHYLLLKNYAVKHVQHKLKLIYTIQEGDNIQKYYVADSELYDILHKTYTSFGYEGRDRIIRKKIITDKIIYSDLWACQKQKDVRQGLTVKLVIFPEFHSQCRVEDVIDF